MAELHVETPEGITLRYELAGPGSRTAAALCDLSLFGILWLCLMFVALVIGGVDPTGVGGFALGLLVGGVLLLPALYQIGFGILGGGRSPGMRLFGLRVTDANGGGAAPMQHVLRGLFWPFEAMVFVFPIPIGLILMAATERFQRLGDLVAGTVVLRDVRRAAVAEIAPRERWSEAGARVLPLVPAHAARLEAEDLTFLREVLGRLDVTPQARARLQRRTALHYLRRLELEHLVVRGGPSPRAVLRELYMFLREARGADPARREASASRRAPDPDGAAGGRGSAPADAARPR